MDSTYVPVPRWQSISSLIFVALFAFLLPFVCWGQIADPSHPHTMVHLVFIDPPIINVEQQPFAQIHKHTDQRQSNQGHTHKVADSASTQSNKGQATPQILLLFTLPFVLMALLRFSVAWQHSFQRLLNRLHGSDWQSPPTSPPPQFTVFLAH